MRGKFMLQGSKNMQPAQHYIQDHTDLYEHIDDPGYVAKEEAFARWYENCKSQVLAPRRKFRRRNKFDRYRGY